MMLVQPDTHTHTHTQRRTWTQTYIDLILLIKINSKWNTNLNVKCKTIKLLEDNTGEHQDDPDYGKDFLDTTPKA